MKQFEKVGYIILVIFIDSKVVFKSIDNSKILVLSIDISTYSTKQNIRQKLNNNFLLDSS